MKYLTLTLLASILGACAYTDQMTPAQRCDAAALALALVERNMPEDSVTVRRAREDYFLLCQNF